MVVFPLPLTGLQDNHVISFVTLHESVPHPVLVMVNDVDPAVLGNEKEDAETVRMGVVLAVWVTVTVSGLHPDTETVIEAVLREQEVLAV
jgi:hypothetical protein